MLSPKRTKYRKVQKGTNKGKASRGTMVVNGDYGIQALEPAWITANQIESVRVTLSRYTKKVGKTWIKIFPDKPITKKPAETRMGSGKGNPEYFVAVVKPGRILFEIAGLSEEVSKEALQKETLKKKILNAQYDVENSQEYSDALARKVKGFYTVTQNDDNSFTYTRNDEAIRTDLMLCGCMALFTTYPNFTASTALRTYNNKDVVEKCFAELKNDILGERLYVHSDEALTGKMFVTFLSLILHKSLQNKLRPWIRKNRSSLDVAFSILSDIECKKCGNQWLLTKVFTSHQKELIKLLQLPVNFLDHK